MRSLAIVLSGMSLAGSALAADCTASLEKVWPYNVSAGDEQWAIGLTAQAEINADCAHASFGALTRADAIVFGGKIKLAEAALATGLDRDNKKWLKSDLSVLGYELDGLDLSTDAQVEAAIAPSFILDHADTYTLSYGPVSLPLSYRVNGVVSLEASADVTGLAATASATPSLNLDAYAEALVSTPFLVAQLDGSVLLVNDRLNNVASLALVQNGDNLSLDYDVYSGNEFEALEGVLKFSAFSPFARDNVYQRDLFSYSGFQMSDVFLDLGESIRLN
ncbi:hypothetical protein [Pseudobacteriovorax antillogorgiicola]|uniref:Uncharacterized protein n=1 Tax=Pseudobacteriovorax antillogorgiicola TaxID=1513793 RepID=A0A1Y6C905_9BACT|nr:hypothetical protein [Pseudobacteriovorax antillogorgiicola]TCS49073.1 hypothetical protein EDD56_116116 [Pseudobacteriovorax antillogorgiicola]SMF52184.1 hypothetical protein SAMN06296036_11638 [Pseudobacteriovorax antillogorgiicola]